MNRFTIRLLAAIWIALLAVIGGFAYQQVVTERERLTQDLTRRAALLGDGLQESIGPALGRGSVPAIERLLKRFGRRDQGIAVYDKVGAMIAASPDVAPFLPVSLPEVTEALTTGNVVKGFRKIGGKPVYVYASPLTLRDDKPAGAVVVFLDASYIAGAEWELWQYNILRALVLAVVLSLVAWLLIRFSIARPMARMTRWTRALRRGHLINPPELADEELFGPMAREVTVLARTLQRAQAAAAEEATLRLVGETLWTEERLKQFVKLRLGASPLFVVSNREPVQHMWREGKIVAETPASGLVTAMDPVMRACGGVWVAQGSGDADAEMTDSRGRLTVPPDDPRYTLRRVWLTKEEEAGYYYGFANEGMWPLCHIVHTRPQFRPEDWAFYRSVNEKFAAAVLDEIAKVESPMVLIQDYHFALLPALIKRERPDARVAIFWHIPWPNFESFSICPWQDELLLGMLGADLIGFHTQYYCNNFLETVERAIEARIDWQHFSVTRGQHTTYVKPFPISVAPAFVEEPPQVSREAMLAQLGVTAEWVGVGVERLDYTKGLPGAVPLAGAVLRALPGLPGARGVRPARRAEPEHHPALSADRGRGGRGGAPGQRDVRDTEVAAHRVSQAPPRPPGHLAVLSARRLLHGDVAPRRDEPGGEGVHLGARRRGRRAHPEPVHGRVVGAPRRPPGESLRPGWHGGGGARCRRDAPRRAPGADGTDAPGRPRAQHLPLGRPPPERAPAHPRGVDRRPRQLGGGSRGRALIGASAGAARPFSRPFLLVLPSTPVRVP